MEAPKGMQFESPLDLVARYRRDSTEPQDSAAARRVIPHQGTALDTGRIMAEMDARFLEMDRLIHQLEQRLEATTTELQETNIRLAELETLLGDVLESDFWRMGQLLSLVAAGVAPSGSRRRRACNFMYRGAKALPKMRDRDYRNRKLAVLSARAKARLSPVVSPFQHWNRQVFGQRRFRRRLEHNPPVFKTLDQVEVSIVIPVYNHCMDTFACLDSIARHAGPTPFEVIVVDDCSSDMTPEMLARVQGLVVVRNEENQGFIGSCNRGAAAARGKYLLFLNNDTEVTPGWVEALVQTFRDFPGTGIAGGKLVYPDGRLQEAGGVIWRDASGWNYGKFEKPDHPRYNYAREADYCSGACLMIPQELFQSLGGFDTHYRPAYYEDTDLAFKVRHAGLKVMYQPLAEVIHYEGLSSGTSLASGVKAHQVVNQVKFRERWAERLARHPQPDGLPMRVLYPHGSAGTAPGQIMVIDHRLPTPDRDAGSVRMFEMLKAMRRMGHHVTFVPDNLLIAEPYVSNLRRIGVEVVHYPFYSTVAGYLKQHGHEYDMVVISRADVAEAHLTTVKRLAPKAKVVFDTVDLHYLRQEREALLHNDRKLKLAAAERKHQELRLMRRSDLTIVVSPVEKMMLEKERPTPQVQVIPTIIDIDDQPPAGLAKRRNIVFIGGFEHPPNVDAVLYFAREVLPLVRRRVPGVVFDVIGPDAPAEVRKLASETVRIHGFVEDVKPLFETARLSVAPIRFGAGVKGKVNMSMALGVPAVVTSVAAEGMFLTHEHSAMIANDPQAFADSVARLLESDELWQHVSAEGLRSVRDHFSIEAATRQIEALLAWAGLDVPGRA